MLTACGNDEKASNDQQAEDKEKITENVEDSSKEDKSKQDENKENKQDEGKQEDEKKTDPLSDVVAYFESNGFTIGEKTAKAYEMVGAVDGFGIELNGANVEFYLYEPDSVDLKTIQEKAQYNMEGFVFPAIANGNIVLMGHDEHPDKDKIEELFKNYK